MADPFDDLFGAEDVNVSSDASLLDPGDTTLTTPVSRFSFPDTTLRTPKSILGTGGGRADTGESSILGIPTSSLFSGLGLLSLLGGGAGLTEGLFGRGTGYTITRPKTGGTTTKTTTAEPTTLDETLTTTPTLLPEARTSLTSAETALGTGSTTLDYLLGLLKTPSIPPYITSLVGQAYEPLIGKTSTRAIESARKRGFAGGAELLNTGPGGAIAGPALADLQGQEAGDVLKEYDKYIQYILDAANAYAGLGKTSGGIATALPTTKTTTTKGTTTPGKVTSITDAPETGGTTKVSTQPSILGTLSAFAPTTTASGGLLSEAEKIKKDQPTGLSYLYP